MVNLGNHFSLVDGRNSERARQRQWFIKARQDRQKKEELAEKLEDDTAALAVDVVMATNKQIREFENKLDQYDAAVVTALMENQKQLDAVNAEITVMLNQAYVMDDGRRVFKSEDGTQVFDEFGEEVSRDELDFDLIGPERPKLENFNQKIYSKEGLEVHREKLLTAQNKLDETREQVSKGGHTQEDLEALDADLQEYLTDDVKTHVPGLKKSTVSHEANVTTKPEVTTPEIQASTPAPV